jgi:hypothetical protein
MRKTIWILICLLSSSLILLSAFGPTLNIAMTNARYVGVGWGHLAVSGGQYNQTEYTWESNVTGYIDGFYPLTWNHTDLYWTWTTSSSVNTAIQYCQNASNSVTWATNWWVGDFQAYSGSPTYYGLIGEGGYANAIWPDPVYVANSPNSKQYFNFIWTCMNAGLYWNSTNGQNNITGITKPDTNYDQSTKPPYTPTNTNTKYGYINSTSDCIGMPLAWTRSSSMVTNAWTSNNVGSYCYIGFENHSPWLGDVTGYNSLYFGYFAYYFYEYALGAYDGQHHTVRDSLNFASQNTLGVAFGSSSLYNGWWWYNPDDMGQGSVGWWYNRMRVFGNADLSLP